MKKLMFGLAALAAGSVMAIESANVVGYQNIDLPSGKAMITPTFQNITDKEIPISQLICSESYDDGEVMIQVVGADGRWGQSALWLAAFEEFPAGWFTDISGNEESDIVLKPGQAIFVSSQKKGTIQSAGQVASEVTTIDIPVGKSMIGNASPVVIGVESLECSSNYEDGEVMIQVVDADGRWGKSALWLAAFEEFPAGWFTDISGNEESDIVLQPGQSVFVSASRAGTVTVPSALAK